MATDRLPFQRRHLPKDLGATLRTAREVRGATRREIAAIVGIGPRTLARIERGEQQPSWKTLEAIGDALGVSMAVVAKRWLQESFDVPTDPEAVPGLGLRALRLARGMTLVTLSARCSVSAATLSRFERGVTVSRLLPARAGGPAVRWEDRDVVLDNAALASAFGFSSSAQLAAACIAAYGDP